MGGGFRRSRTKISDLEYNRQKIGIPRMELGRVKQEKFEEVVFGAGVDTATGSIWVNRCNLGRAYGTMAAAAAVGGGASCSGVGEIVIAE
jgi:hypothetical protein